jgi:hypothetical protein
MGDVKSQSLTRHSGCLKVYDENQTSIKYTPILFVRFRDFKLHIFRKMSETFNASICGKFIR